MFFFVFELVARTDRQTYGRTGKTRN